MGTLYVGMFMYDVPTTYLHLQKTSKLYNNIQIVHTKCSRENILNSRQTRLNLQTFIKPNFYRQCQKNRSATAFYHLEIVRYQNILIFSLITIHKDLDPTMYHIRNITICYG